MQVSVGEEILGCMDGEPMRQLKLDPEAYDKLLWMMSDECDIAVPFWFLARKEAVQGSLVAVGRPQNIRIIGYVITTPDQKWFMEHLHEVVDG